jgi:hypothetical protein
VVRVDLSTATRSQLEKLSKSKHWQEQSAAWAQIKAHGWMHWKKPDGNPYRAFAEYCWEVGTPPSTAYLRASLAEHPRFGVISQLEISQRMALKLYELDDALFEVFSLLVEMGLSEAKLAEFLNAPEPLALALRKASELTLILERLNRLLSTKPAAAPAPDGVHSRSPQT